MLKKAGRKLRSAMRSLLGLDADVTMRGRQFQALDGVVRSVGAELARLRLETDDIKMLLGQLHAERVRSLTSAQFPQGVEFKVFSQFGDDGIIQFLIHALKPCARSFIEFGVTDYAEANTRFLILNDNWRGLVLDGDPKMIERVRSHHISVLRDLTAASAFVDAANVNEVFLQNGFEGELGLLSIDIDGNDYWVWEAINVVDPLIVVCEYNSVFGPDDAVTVPYDPAFVRQDAHHSRLFYGASLAALCHLGQRKGYAFVGCNSHGNNAYFVKADRAGALKVLTPDEGYVESRFRESVDDGGRHTFIGGSDRISVIADCEVVRVTDGARMKVRDTRQYVRTVGSAGEVHADTNGGRR